MSVEPEFRHDSRQSTDDQLDGLLFYTPLSLDLVSALAGDRPLSKSETDAIDRMQQARGEKFYSDLLYTVTHRFFPPSGSRNIWTNILRHKYEMSSVLKRNIRIAVASLDYLSNLTSELHSPTLTDESFLTELVRLSVRDGLTGLFNHSSFFQKLDAEMQRYVRYNTTVALLMIDIDNFKKINDTFGHQAGDNLLNALAVIVREEARESDICCRYGGEEFTVIMPLTDIANAATSAERLRERVARSLFDGRAITVSIGVAASGENVGTSQELVKKADAALYEAKENGKNRVVTEANSGVQVPASMASPP